MSILRRLLMSLHFYFFALRLPPHVFRFFFFAAGNKILFKISR